MASGLGLGPNKPPLLADTCVGNRRFIVLADVVERQIQGLSGCGCSSPCEISL